MKIHVLAKQYTYIEILRGVCDVVKEYSYSHEKAVLSVSTIVVALRAKYSNQQFDPHEFFTSVASPLHDKLPPK